MAERASRRGAAGIDRPVVWEDLTREQQDTSESAIGSLGNIRSALPGAIGDIRSRLETSTMNDQGRKKYELSARNMEDMLADDSVVDKPITLAGATQSRIELLTQAKNNARMRSTITGQRELPRGAGWYSEHKGRQYAATGGEMDPVLAAAIGGKLSASKTPDDEIAGLHGIHRLTKGSANHTITVHDPSFAAKLGVAVGKPHLVSALRPDQIASAAQQAASEHLGANSTTAKSVTSTDHEALVLAGRPHQDNVAEAITMMRHPDVVSGKQSPMTIGFDPASTPKTWSYGTSTAEAGETGSVAHQDYLNVAHHWAHGDPNQGMMLFGRGSENEPPHPSLSPDEDTAEDTWQQAVDTSQLGTYTNRQGRKSSVGKRVVTDAGAVASTSRLTKEVLGVKDTPVQVTPVGVRHAFGNKATRNAATAMGPISFDQFNNPIHMPARMAQEIAWTQMRANVGADAPFNAEQRTWDKAAKTETKTKTDAEKLSAKGVHLEGQTGEDGKPLPPKKYTQGSLF